MAIGIELRLLSVATVAFITEGPIVGQTPQFPDFAKPVWALSEPTSKITDERYLVIDDVRSWKGLWNEHAPESTQAPKIDFDSAIVLCVFNPKWRNAGETFGFDRIARGALSSDLSSFNVMLGVGPATADRKANRVAMIQVDKTRLDFRFYAPERGSKDKDKDKLVARIDPLARFQPAESLQNATRDLIREFDAATADRKSKILRQVTAMGNSILPYLHRRAAETSGRKDFWVVRKFLDRMLQGEAETQGKAVRYSEVALAKALREVGRQIKSEPWYTRQQTRRVGDLWYVSLAGTFSVFSGVSTANQRDVHAKVVLRAGDGGVVSVDIQRR